MKAMSSDDRYSHLFTQLQSQHESRSGSGCGAGEDDESGDDEDADEDADNSGCSRHMTGVKQYLHIYSKESSLKVVFRDNSSSDTEGYGLVNCNGITFTRVAYANGLKHNLISIGQLCDANFKVLFTKTQGTIFNENDKVDLIAPRRRDVYVMDIKMENLNEVRVKEPRSDNETEFKNHKLKEFYNEKGISQNFSSPCTPKQNGVAERRNKTLIEAARTRLNSANIPRQFWGEAVNIACYTQNKSIIVKRHGKTAYDVFRERSLDISYIYVFGFLVYIHNYRDHLGKFDKKANDEFFLGYSLVAKSFRVFKIKIQEMKETYHFTFNEDDEAISQSSTEGSPLHKQHHQPKNIPSIASPIIEDFVSHEEPPEFTTADDHPIVNKPDSPDSANIFKSFKDHDHIISEPISDAEPSPSINIKPSSSINTEPLTINREPLAGVTTRSRIRDSKATSSHECLYVNFLSKIKPKKMIEALEEEGWIIAINKMDENEVVIKDKARLVAQGFRQEERIDYDECPSQPEGLLLPKSKNLYPVSKIQTTVAMLQLFSPTSPAPSHVFPNSFIQWVIAEFTLHYPQKSIKKKSQQVSRKLDG
nr:hypothetical protein [Tanacetum cinerariifolium]